MYWYKLNIFLYIYVFHVYIDVEKLNQFLNYLYSLVFDFH